MGLNPSNYQLDYNSPGVPQPVGVIPSTGGNSSFLNPLAGLDSVVNAVTGGYNIFANERARADQRDYYDDQKLREDNAVQRRRADLEAAGLHPTLAVGNPAQSAPTTAYHPNQVNAPDLKGIQLSMLKLQMRSMEADIDNKLADTNLKDASAQSTRDSNSRESEKHPLNMSVLELDKVSKSLGIDRSRLDLLIAEIDRKVKEYEYNYMVKYKSHVPVARSPYVNRIKSEIEDLFSAFGVKRGFGTDFLKKRAINAESNRAKMNDFIKSENITSEKQLRGSVRTRKRKFGIW